MKNLPVFLLFLLMLGVYGYSQDDNTPVRVEFDARAEVFQLIPCGRQGALLFYESINYRDEKNKSWVTVFYDTDLKPIWSKEIPVLRNLSFSNYFRDGAMVYLVFQNTAKSRSDEYNLQLYCINILDSSMETFEMFTPDKADLVDFEVKGNTFVAGLNHGKEEALIIIKNLSGSEEKVIKFEENPTYIEDLSFDSTGATIYVALDVYSLRKQSTLYLNRYDLQANLVNSIQVVPINPTEKFMNAQVYVSNPNEIYLLGSYNNLNGRSSPAEQYSEGEQSEGFYIAKIAGDEQKFVRFHKLLEFKNIKTILNNEQLSEVNDILKKSKKKGKTGTLNYEFLIHDMISHDDEFILVSEAYYPEYHQVSTMSYDFYGRPVPYYYTVFDGYSFFNAFIAGMNRDGDLVWSNGIKIWDITSFFLHPIVEVFFDGDEAVLFYNHDGMVVSKVFKDYEDIGETEHAKIATNNPADVQMEASNGRISHWYDQFFLASGYQTIRNSGSDGGSKRRVFYFNKLVFN